MICNYTKIFIVNLLVGTCLITDIICQKTGNEFIIFSGQIQSSIYYDKTEPEVVKISANLLARDIERITGYQPPVSTNISDIKGHAILIGTVNSTTLITLAEKQFIGIENIKNKWEVFQLKVIDNPFDSINKALIICGSDRRGTAYGVFEISGKIGVSPWYWWADVPVKQKKELVLYQPGFISERPSVKYRGIFINDEDWGIQPWAAKTFEPETGSIGPKTYARIFELLLRLKANLIWPAMHNCTKAFYTIPGNKETADRYAIVIGTSHAEPMLRNNVGEWDKKQRGDYNYVSNKIQVLSYWEERIKEAGKYENLYTTGMRGIHDSPMSGARSKEQRVQIMEEIIDNQREILHKYCIETTPPMIFVPYKEVLDIYNNGLQLDDDITLVWPDDNYGYIRRLSNLQEQKRKGRSGVYYHASYWGRPHDYLWLPSTHPALIREEMIKAYGMKADYTWVLNVGDIKPIEFHMQMFLDMAYNINRFSDSKKVKQYINDWVKNIFGYEYAGSITEILWEYYNLAFERRPEFMGWSMTEPTTETSNTDFNHFYYGDEAQKRIDRYEVIETEVKKLKQELDNQYKDSFYQLVYYPVVCASAMNKKFLYAEKATYYQQQHRASAKDYGILARQAFECIKAETKYYNDSLSGGKWKYLMSYQPRRLPVFNMPEIPEYEFNGHPDWDIMPEGDYDQIPDTEKSNRNSRNNTDKSLPAFNPWTDNSYFVDIFINTNDTLTWTAVPSDDWIILSQYSGRLSGTLNNKQQRIWISIDWESVPKNHTDNAYVEFSAISKSVKAEIKLFNPEIPQLKNFKGFIEINGYISIYAGNYNTKHDYPNAWWEIIEGLGYTGKSVQAMPYQFVSITDTSMILQNSPYLEYKFYSFTETEPVITTCCIPTHPLHNQQSMRFAFSIDNEPMKIVDFRTYGRSEEWKQNVLRNSAQVTTIHNKISRGIHILRIYSVDPGVIIDRLIINMGGLKNAYSKIPQTYINTH